MVSLFVTVQIPAEAREEFLEVMQQDVTGSRKEPGCIAFHLLEHETPDNTFSFYECYADADAIAFHKTQPHYKLWADFKAKYPSIGSSQQVVKTSKLL